MIFDESLDFDGKHFIKIFEINKLKILQPSLVELPPPISKKVVLILLDGKVFAFDDYCPHQHKPSLHLGYVENGCIVCPEHGWAFPLVESKTLKESQHNPKLKMYEILLKDGFVYIRIDNFHFEKWKSF